jgi:bla regulator protein blaR1
MTDWLFDTLVATSGLLVLVMLLRAPVARIFGPNVVYWLWLLPAARLFMPVLTKEVAAPQPAEILIHDTALSGSPNPVGELAPAIDWLSLGLIAWLGGAALLFFVQMARYVTMRDALLGDAAEIDRIGTICVIQSDRIGGPLAFGLFRRFIAVPEHFATAFSPKERELALAHEIAHHKAGDLYANLAAFIFLCLNWFNPLAWMAWSAFRFDQEAACDARVLAGADRETRQRYGRTLARSAADPTLALAMALNTPSTIIRRLRRLTMNDFSKRRRLAGRLAIITGVAIALPMTATVVPVFAEDKASADAVEKRTTRVIIVKNKDGSGDKVEVTGDAEAPFVKTIQKDGKTIVLRSTKDLSDADVEKLVANIDTKRVETEALSKGLEEAGANVDQAAVKSIRIVSGKDFDNLIPEIDVREMREKCKDGDGMTTDVRGFDGKEKASVVVSVCGKGQAKLARGEAVNGMRQALKEIREDKDIPENLRKSVLATLEQQIERMEKEQAQEDSGSK